MSELEQARTNRRIRAAVRRRAGRPLDPVRSAEAARLRYVNDNAGGGIRRIGRPPHFRYVDAHGKPIDEATRRRVRALVIPPAWTGVWICSDPRGHLQATGRDARGRKQYRYHPRWREVRDETKYSRLAAFARALPAIRARTEADLKRSGLTRERVLAVVVQLLEKTLIRVGNEEYARDNQSFGLTTFRDSHAKIEQAAVRFVFRGKSGKNHEVSLHDRRLAQIVKACRDLPGHELFQYVDEHGKTRAIGSGDVNEYLRAISGQEFTAKDFRTWAGTVLAATTLARMRQEKPASRATKRSLVRAIESVAERLGNTKAVCRKSYIHPAVLDGYLDGRTIRVARLRAVARSGSTSLSAEEAAVVAFLEKSLRKRRTPDASVA